MCFHLFQQYIGKILPASLQRELLPEPMYPLLYSLCPSYGGFAGVVMLARFEGEKICFVFSALSWRQTMTTPSVSEMLEQRQPMHVGKEALL